METQKLYYSEPFLKEFTASVLSCEEGKDCFLVTLDRTAFYPEGGGQSADHGILGGSSVTDVHEKDGVIYHSVDRSVNVGETVACSIDWERRFDHMQQHSGEHILSGILCADYHCDNVGFHMGAETVTIDYNTDITWEQCMSAEAKANAIIFSDTPCEVFYPTPRELAALSYRSKKELSGEVRIVRFPGADCCACCGTHVLRAGQVGLIKILSCQKFRNGVRMEIVCGNRALRYLSDCFDQAKAVGRKFSLKPTEILRGVERMEQDLSDYKTRISQLESTAWDLISREYEGKENVLLFQPPMGGDSLRRLGDAVARKASGTTALFAGSENRWSYALLRNDGSDITSFVKDMNAALHGRGGGRNGFAQGSVEATEQQIREYFTDFSD